jgi:YgiT-type zinc finger domain-containing protein
MTRPPSITTKPALLLIRNGRQWWTCPACKKTLGEVTAGHVEVKIGPRQITLISDVTVQTCPQCGAASMYEREAA